MYSGVYKDLCETDADCTVGLKNGKCISQQCDCEYGYVAETQSCITGACTYKITDYHFMSSLHVAPQP